MKYRFDGYNYLLRLEKGEMLVETLVRFALEKQIKGGWVSAIGGALSAELGYYHLDEQRYAWRKLDRVMEITSVHGPLAWAEDKPALHLHAQLSDAQLQSYGGHLKELTVGGTCEVFIHVWNQTDNLTRSHDDTVGLKLLDV